MVSLNSSEHLSLYWWYPISEVYHTNLMSSLRAAGKSKTPALVEAYFDCVSPFVRIYLSVLDHALCKNEISYLGQLTSIEQECWIYFEFYNIYYKIFREKKHFCHQ